MDDSDRDKIRRELDEITEALEDIDRLIPCIIENLINIHKAIGDEAMLKCKGDYFCEEEND